MTLRPVGLRTAALASLIWFGCSPGESVTDMGETATTDSDSSPSPNDTGAAEAWPEGLFLQIEPLRAASDGAPPMPVRVPLTSNLAEVTLPRTVLFEGAWTTEVVQPILRALAPVGRTMPAAGSLTFVDPIAATRFTATFDADGRFGLALPAGRWSVGFEASEPGAAPGSWTLIVGAQATDAAREAPPAETYDLALDAGAPLYGRILRAETQSTGLSGTVYALSADGTASTAPQRLGAAGDFELRVQPGLWDLVVDPDGDADPIRRYPFTVDALGANKTILIPPTKAKPLRVAYALNGEPIVGASVRFRALRLADGGDASFEAEGVTDADGVFTADVPVGQYTVELVPRAESPYSAWWTTVDVDPAIDLGVIDIAPTTPATVQVLDITGTPVVGAQVRIEEGGAGYRSWSAVTDAEGRAEATVTGARAAIVLVPPGSRPDLAQTRVEFEGGEAPPVLSFGRGLGVVGVIRDALGAASPYAAVRVVDAEGRSYALGLTDVSGAFSMRFTPPQAVEPDDPAGQDTASATPIDTGRGAATR